jgi:hypothetical protein
MSEVADKVLKLYDSTKEMIDLSYKSIDLYNKMNRAVIKEKLLKDVAHKVIQPKELSKEIKELLLNNKIDVTKFSHFYRGDQITAYDNNITEIRTTIKNVDTIVYVINDKVVLCPV